MSGLFCLWGVKVLTLLYWRIHWIRTLIVAACIFLFDIMLWQIILATLLCCMGRYIEILRFGHVAIMCWLVSLELPQTRKFELISSLFKRFAFKYLVRISFSWIADLYPSTCEEIYIFPVINLFDSHLLGYYLYQLESGNQAVAYLSKFDDGFLSFFLFSVQVF